MTSNILFHSIFFLFPAVMAYAASTDLLTMTIPNRACLALALGYFILALVVGLPFDVIAINLSCGAAVLAATFVLFAKGWIGGGDAKLAAASALWLGWALILNYGLIASVFGGVLTLVLIVGRRAPLPEWAARLGWLARLHHPESGVPYGIALAAAGLVMYPQTEIWRKAVGL
ncbi:MAG: prepilin peptidase [Roseiarcus sp.]|jgi:prepilin peptidase CpaA